MLDLWLNNRCIATTSGDVLMPPPVLHEWQAAEFRCVPPPDCALVLELTGPLYAMVLEPFLRPGDPAWYWNWNPQNRVGRFHLKLKATSEPGGSYELRAGFDVLPAKLSQEHYSRLLADMQQLGQGLALSLASSSAGAALHIPAPGETRDSALLVEYCRFYEGRIAELERLVARIQRMPHSELRPTSQQVPAGQARTLAALRPADMAEIAPEHLPATVTQAASAPTLDTYENRLLKRLLDEYWRRLRWVTAGAAELASTSTGGSAAAAHTIAERSSALAQRLQALRRQPWLASVASLHSVAVPPSLPMRRDTPYRQVYRFWRELRQTPTLEVDSPLFHLSVADLSRLYECWCVLQVAGMLLDLHGAVVKHEQMFCWRGTAASFSATLALTEHTPLLTLAWQGGELRLRYQPRYRPAEAAAGMLPVSLDRQTHIPDLALEWSHPDRPPLLLVLDAKYRLDASGGVPAAALADAYTYLGALGLPDGTRLVQGVALLYPGTGAGEQYASGVSVLPLLPDAAAPLEQWLSGALAALA